MPLTPSIIIRIITNSKRISFKQISIIRLREEFVRIERFTYR